MYVFTLELVLSSNKVETLYSFSIDYFTMGGATMLWMSFLLVNIRLSNCQLHIMPDLPSPAGSGKSSLANNAMLGSDPCDDILEENERLKAEIKWLNDVITENITELFNQIAKADAAIDIVSSTAISNEAHIFEVLHFSLQIFCQFTCSQG